MRPNDNSPIKVDRNWKRVSSFPSEETLITVYRTTERHSCLCLDLNSGSCFALPLLHEPITVSPVFDKARNELIYACISGIATFNLSNGQDNLLIPIDWEYYQVEQMWLSPEDPARLIYLMAERELPWSKLVAQLRATKSEIQVNMKFSLHELATRQAAPTLVTRFPSKPVSIDASWHDDVFFAMVGVERRKELIKIDLKTKSLEKIRDVEGFAGVTVSPRRNPILWSVWRKFKIAELLPSGEESILTDFGWYPAFSPDGHAMAFTVDECQLWLRDYVHETTEKIVSLPDILTHHRFDSPAWCSCGNHFAVHLTDPSGNRDRRALAIGDCGGREVIIIEGLQWIQGNRLWVPTSAVRKYLTGDKVKGWPAKHS